MRITIEIDGASREGLSSSGTAVVQLPSSLEAEDGGISRNAAESALSADAAEDGGAPPQWLVDEIERASAQAEQGAPESGGGVIDAGASPE